MVFGSFFRRIGSVEAKEGFIFIPPGREDFFPENEFTLIFNGDKKQVKLEKFEKPVKHHRINFEKLSKGDVVTIKQVEKKVFTIEK